MKGKIYCIAILSLVQVLFSCKNDNANENQNGGTANEKNVTKNPVLMGDFADPSVVRVGNDYWATATSSEWAPLFPILHSTNLKDWEIVEHVFPENLPSWAEAHFWAPEISYDNGKFYIYYTAKKKDGPLCVGVASSESATGPYRDHGPIVCQEAGAIDGFQIRDDEGKLFLIWKEDGNSRGEPTPMWGQEMNEDRTELIGERFELFRNDPETWEGNLVEGAYLLKRDQYYYAFYSGDACCGRNCTYGIGVARSQHLEGPWEKYGENPLKRKNEVWKCAGHGSLVQDEKGRYFFLYHAYSKEGSVYTGRQGLLDEVVWREDGWPEFKENTEQEVVLNSDDEVMDIEDDFSGNELSKRWQWPVGNKPGVSISDNSLILKSSSDNLGAVLARRSLSPNYEAMVTVQTENTSGRAGIAVIGDQNNAMGISLLNNEIVVWKSQGGNEEIIGRATFNDLSKVHLKMEVNGGEDYSFSWSENGEDWSSIEESENLEGSYLPPWDRAVRIGLVSKGATNQQGGFSSFNVFNKSY